MEFRFLTVRGESDLFLMIEPGVIISVPLADPQDESDHKVLPCGAAIAISYVNGKCYFYLDDRPGDNWGLVPVFDGPTVIIGDFLVTVSEKEAECRIWDFARGLFAEFPVPPEAVGGEEPMSIEGVTDNMVTLRRGRDVDDVYPDDEGTGYGYSLTETPEAVSVPFTWGEWNMPPPAVPKGMTWPSVRI